MAQGAIQDGMTCNTSFPMKIPPQAADASGNPGQPSDHVDPHLRDGDPVIPDEDPPGREGMKTGIFLRKRDPDAEVA